MTYRKFREWCNERAWDGCWGLQEARLCIDVMNTIQQLPFWKRNKVWKKIEYMMIVEVVTPTNLKLQEIRCKQG